MVILKMRLIKQAACKAIKLVRNPIPAFNCEGFADARTAVDAPAKDCIMVASRTMGGFFDLQWRVVSMPAGYGYAMSAPASLKFLSLPQ